MEGLLEEVAFEIDGEIWTLNSVRVGSLESLGTIVGTVLSIVLSLQ